MSHNNLLEIINDVIDTAIRPYQGELLLNLRMFVDSDGKYRLQYTISHNFISDSILKEGCFNTTDDLLRWGDFTDIINDFDIEILTPKKSFKMSYYELMNESIGKTRHITDHPRKDKFEKYFTNKEDKYFSNISGALKSLEKEKKYKTFFGELKYKIVSLWSKK